jgi:hypothetical protein
VNAKVLGGLATAVLLLLAGCGGGGSGISTSAGRELGAQVDALRLASHTDRDTAAAQLARFRAELDRLRAGGQLTRAAAKRIAAAADGVESQLWLLPTTTTTTTTTTTAPPGFDRPGKGHDQRDRPGRGRDQPKD